MKLNDQEINTIDDVIDCVGSSTYEIYIAHLTEKGSDSVFSYFSSYEMSRDDVMKKMYLEAIRNKLKKGANIEQYIFGFVFANNIDRKDLIDEFRENMINNHPFLGRVYSLGIPFFIWRSSYK